MRTKDVAPTRPSSLASCRPASSTPPRKSWRPLRPGTRMDVPGIDTSCRPEVVASLATCSSVYYITLIKVPFHEAGEDQDVSMWNSVQRRPWPADVQGE